MRIRWHLLALVLIALGVGLCFLRQPGLGDDFYYWSIAFDFRERGLEAWDKGSFHHLRWPVWGVSWLLQAAFGPGLLSYHGVGLLYFAVGAVVTFTFAMMVSRFPAGGATHATGHVGLAWSAALAFLFHPLLDTLSNRPMPDLSEGVFGAVIMLIWWHLMQAQGRKTSLLFAALLGTGVAVIEANRVTGMFIVPVLVTCTLLYFPRRFGLLLLAGGVAALVYLGECAFYRWLFGDWLHDLSANSNNLEAKGTEFGNPWALPFRFLDTLWKSNPLAPFYCILALIGMAFAWLRHGTLGRVLVIWAVMLYGIYACAPQSLSPVRPLVRDADRFLAALAPPLSILAALGLWGIIGWLSTRQALSHRLEHMLPRLRWRYTPALFNVVTVALMVGATSRPSWNLGFVPGMQRYLATLPDTTKVFTHESMRRLTFLVSPNDARRLEWTAPQEILHARKKYEAAALQCDEFWYQRTLVWNTARLKLERSKTPVQPPLESYFADPGPDWRLTEVLARGDSPDIVFYRRRVPGDPQALVSDTALEGSTSIIPKLPATWQAGRNKTNWEDEWDIPESWRGGLARIEFTAAAPKPDACNIHLHFRSASRSLAEYRLKPYLYSGGGREFFVVPIPPEARTCQIKIKFSSNAKQVELTNMRIFIERPEAKLTIVQSTLPSTPK